MDGPSDDLRSDVLGRVAETRQADFAGADALAEERLVEELTRITGQAAEDFGASQYRTTGVGSEDDGWDLLAAVQAWAGLASAAVANVYAPASPWPRNLAGWGKKAVAALQAIAKVLLTPLQLAAKALGASNWSFGVGFPWGISVSLGWP